MDMTMSPLLGQSWYFLLELTNRFSFFFFKKFGVPKRVFTPSLFSSGWCFMLCLIFKWCLFIIKQVETGRICESLRDSETEVLNNCSPKGR